MTGEEKLGALRLLYAEGHAREFDDLVNESDAVESPIERLLLAAFLARGGRYAGGDHRWDDRWREMKAAPSWEFVVMNHLGRLGSQVTIDADGSRYRIDFALLSVEGPPIAIECDGHEFHEKTKEQVERDKGRERALTKAGWRVVRFAGSEIWRDPLTCVDSVDAIVNELWGKP